MRRNVLKVILASFLFSFILFVFAENISASGGPAVSPAIINLSPKAGESSGGSFIYMNNSATDQTITLDLRPFVPSNGEKGSPVFTDSNGNAVTSPLKDWIKLDNTTYLVPAGKQVTISFGVSVPGNAEVKKYYVAIVAGEKQNTQSISGSSISTEIGVLVVADVQKSLSPVSTKGIKSYPWYFYAMVVAFILAIITAISIYIKRD